MKLANIDHSIIDLMKIGCNHISCTNVNAKKKNYIPCQTGPLNDLKYCYSDLYFNNKSIVVTTPVMICPFGISNQGNNFNICLQFTNYTEDSEMNSFFDFIQTLEYKQMVLLGLSETDSESFISQIKYDKKGKYDPNLQVKIPFTYNRFNTDIFSDNYDSIGIMNISKFCKLKCDIYLDKIWKYNDKYISKWKARVIQVI